MLFSEYIYVYLGTKVGSGCQKQIMDDRLMLIRFNWKIWFF